MPDLVSFLTALPVFSPITLLATAGSSWQLPPLVNTMFASKKTMLLVEERKSLVATKNLLGNVDNITSILIISTILFWRCFRALYHCEWIHKTIWSDAIQILFIIIVINIKIIKNILIIPHIFHQHNLMCENFTQKRAWIVTEISSRKNSINLQNQKLCVKSHTHLCKVTHCLTICIFTHSVQICKLCTASSSSSAALLPSLLPSSSSKYSPRSSWSWSSSSSSTALLPGFQRLRLFHCLPRFFRSHSNSTIQVMYEN